MLNLNFPGRAPDDMIGRVFGPDTAGAHYAAVSTASGPDGAPTRVRMVPLPPGETRLYLDPEAQRADGQRQVRIPVSAIGPDGTILPLDADARP